MIEVYEYVKSIYEQTRKPVKVSQIQKALGFKHERRVTERATKLRQNGYMILPTNDGYIIGDKQDCQNLYSRLDTMIDTVISVAGNEGFEHIKSKLFSVKKQKSVTNKIHPQQITIFDKEALSQ